MKGILKIVTIVITITTIVWGALSISAAGLRKSERVDISKRIKKHNEATQEHNNSMFPSVAKPANSKVTIFAGDSVKVIAPRTINVLWQDISSWDNETARKVAAINPNKFIINIDGPGSLHRSTTGPHPTELVGFIKTLTQTYNYSGILVMHPDCNKAEFKHDWNNGSGWYSKGWQRYADYFVLLNDTLIANKLPTFTELLIETEGSGMGAKVNAQVDIFNNFRNYIKDSSIKLAATSDWNKTSFPTNADYYYAQMYDVCYDKKDGGIPALCGINDPLEIGRVNTLVTNMKSSITLNRLDQVSFIFTYAKPRPKCPSIKPTNKTTLAADLICACPAWVRDKCPTLLSPMFGETFYYWTEDQFTKFTKAFQESMNDASVGIWHCESPLKNWK